VDVKLKVGEKAQNDVVFVIWNIENLSGVVRLDFVSYAVKNYPQKSTKQGCARLVLGLLLRHGIKAWWD